MPLPRGQARGKSPAGRGVGGSVSTVGQSGHRRQGLAESPAAVCLVRGGEAGVGLAAADRGSSQEEREGGVGGRGGDGRGDGVGVEGVGGGGGEGGASGGESGVAPGLVVD